MADSYVGKPCPKCRHVRAAAEIAPDWQCPKCGVAYAKFLQAQQAQSAPAPGPGVRATAGSAPASASVAAAAGGSTGLAMFAHLSILLGFILPLVNIIVPVVIWNMKRGEDEVAVACAKEAINFQISLLLWVLVVLAGALLGFVMPPVIYLVMLLGVVLGLAGIILPIVATVKASGGEIYTYPFTWHLFS